MAHRPKLVEIGGATLDEVWEVTFEVETPAEADGQYGGKTFAVKATVIRESTNPQIEFFANATNRTGKLNLIDARFELEGREDQATYTIKFSKCYISSYEINNPEEGDEPITEIIELRAGDVEVSAGGETVNYKMSEFGLKA